MAPPVIRANGDDRNRVECVDAGGNCVCAARSSQGKARQGKAVRRATPTLPLLLLIQNLEDQSYSTDEWCIQFKGRGCVDAGGRCVCAARSSQGKAGIHQHQHRHDHRP
jgi:hypothetical protein